MFSLDQNVKPIFRLCEDLIEHDEISIPLRFHNKELLQNLESAKIIKQKKLINLWNSHHFTDGMVYVQLNHPQYNEDILVWAHPEPCSSDSMICRWPEGTRGIVENAEILNIIFTDGLSVFLIPTELKDIQKDYFTINLPEKGYALGQRRARRYLCQGIEVEVVQSGFWAQGRLIDFSALAFSVEVSPEEIGSFRWFNAGCPSTVHLYRNGQMIFSATCDCIRQTSDQAMRDIVFAPTVSQINRFLKKKTRNSRVEVNPRPNINFDHPATRKKIKLDIHDLSTSGFTVYVSADEDVLMVGMIIPDLTINYGGVLKIECKAQVLYRREEEKGNIRYGFVILDMDVMNYNRLSHIIINIIDPHTHIANEVDVDQLWKFLFESGFIYPKKYDLVQVNRHPMKEIYRKLYRDNPEFIAQMTYQRNGKIYGHISMIHSYERTWMIHHLAATTLNNKRTGLQVLKQSLRYIDGFYRLPSVGMDYMMFYFRPENIFPDHFFGGFSRHLNNPSACSLDLFSYFSYPTDGISQPLPAEWSLEPFISSDSDKLDHFYMNISGGGLLLKVLRLDKEYKETESLSQLYSRYGFKRSCQSFSLKYKGMLKAVLVENQSDPGLNLSDFLNGIKVIVNDEVGLPWEILSAAISQLVGRFAIDKIPVLVYPSSYLESKGVPFKKKYNMWILDVYYARECVEYMTGGNDGKHETAP
ncbi:hypothetical protein ASZ90_008766 [hydrocarbon metagenome]|uniref:PilZ domain-containing protein n=1 Tax=hydrocarbon metagenome TaxID=938273 RepID=A0A0W8FKT4_9ZZZZ